MNIEFLKYFEIIRNRKTDISLNPTSKTKNEIITTNIINDDILIHIIKFLDDPVDIKNIFFTKKINFDKNIIFNFDLYQKYSNNKKKEPDIITEYNFLKLGLSYNESEIFQVLSRFSKFQFEINLFNHLFLFENRDLNKFEIKTCKTFNFSKEQEIEINFSEEDYYNDNSEDYFEKNNLKIVENYETELKSYNFNENIKST
jgi:hypothetical protein